MILSSLFLLLLLPFSLADSTVYSSGSTALESGWEDWSYSSVITYNDGPSTSLSGISVNATAWGAFSAYAETSFGNTATGLTFDLATSDLTQIQIYLNNVAGNSSATYAVSAISGSSAVTATEYTTLTLDLSDLPVDATWDRLNWQAEANGAVFYLNNIILSTSSVSTSGGAGSNLPMFEDGATSFATGWENWSWGDTIVFQSTAISGYSGMEVTLSTYSALSFYAETPFGNEYAGMSFDIATTDPTQIQIYFNDLAGNSSDDYLLSGFDGASAITDTAFTTIVVNFNDLPPSGSALPVDSTWDRINFMSLGNGATFYIDNIELVASITIPPLILSVEPIANNLIIATTQGGADPSILKIYLNGEKLSVTNITSYVPVDTPASNISYIELGSSLAPGVVAVTNGTYWWNTTLPELQYGSITTGEGVRFAISPLIYGINFPTDADYIQHLGVKLSRWGGNARTAYNFEGDFTNTGDDWYFTNVGVGTSADDWVGWITEAGSSSILLVPALDWVAKDDTSYSYSKEVYPDQESFDPYIPDAGDGIYPNGSAVQPPVSQTVAYKPWNTSLAQTWLTGLVNKPTFFTVDNEIEIASSTHQDMHPDSMGYDEELKRVINTIVAVKEVLPNATFLAPSTCAWWFYWTSEIGYTDNEAHDNMDFLPWFLQQMNDAETTYGKRLLDYLDIHAYFQATTNDTAAGKALRLRMTRGFWDPTYIDESYVGTTDPTPWNEPNPNALWLIPRFREMIDEYYPGTRLSFTEWSTGNDSDITGGLAAADCLGIMGVYGLDASTYWEDPDEIESPVALAFWLFNGYGTYFGDTGVQVSLSQPASTSADVLGVYAALDDNEKLAVIIINKDVNPISIYISNIPTGDYFIRHFGGNAGSAKWQTTMTLQDTNYITVPYYTAIMFKQL